MYTLIRHITVREGLLAEAPALVLSFAAAEVFYKFHSFTLECVCFLATWLALSTVLAFFTRRQQAAHTGRLN